MKYASLLLGLFFIISMVLLMNLGSQKVFEYFQGEYKTQKYTYNINSFELKKEKENTIFFPMENEYIIIQKKDGSTLTIDPNEIKVKRGETTRLTEKREVYTRSKDIRRTIYTLVLSNDEYVSFSKDYARTFNRDL